VAGWFHTKEMKIFKLHATYIFTFILFSLTKKMTDLSPPFWEAKTKILVYIETKHDETVSKLDTTAKTYSNSNSNSNLKYSFF